MRIAWLFIVGLALGACGPQSPRQGKSSSQAKAKGDDALATGMADQGDAGDATAAGMGTTDGSATGVDGLGGSGAGTADGATGATGFPPMGGAGQIGSLTGSDGGTSGTSDGGGSNPSTVGNPGVNSGSPGGTRSGILNCLMREVKVREGDALTPTCVNVRLLEEENCKRPMVWDEAGGCYMTKMELDCDADVATRWNEDALDCEAIDAPGGGDDGAPAGLTRITLDSCEGEAVRKIDDVCRSIYTLRSADCTSPLIWDSSMGCFANSTELDCARDPARDFVPTSRTCIESPIGQRKRECEAAGFAWDAISNSCPQVGCPSTHSLVGYDGEDPICRETRDKMVLSVGLGEWHGCAVFQRRDTSGALSRAVRCWGDNDKGRLGYGTTGGSDRVSPGASSIYSAVGSAYSLTAGTHHTCIIHNTDIQCWGYYNRIGHPESGAEDRGSPYTVTIPGRVSGETLTQVTAGEKNTCAIVGGKLFCWGESHNGLNGTGNTAHVWTPARALGTTTNVISVGSGRHHSCAIIEDQSVRKVFCWGDQNEGRTGTGTTSSGDTFIHQFVPGTEGVTKLAVGLHHSCAIVGGALKCWGNGHDRATGLASGHSYQPDAISGLGSGVTDVDVGHHATCAVQNGAVKCFGQGHLGQLGNGANNHSAAAVAVNSPMNANVVAIHAGLGFNCGIVIENNVEKMYCWGEGDNYRMGSGSQTDQNVPTLVSDQ